VPPREWKLRIEDMLEAIGKIQDYVHGMTFETYRSDSKTMDAVARNFEIIGEAARHVPADVLRETALDAPGMCRL
jgi:uncharacterized protein with HEPN domain